MQTNTAFRSSLAAPPCATSRSMVGKSSTVWLRRQRQVTSAWSTPSRDSATEAISEAVSIESSTSAFARLLRSLDDGQQLAAARALRLQGDCPPALPRHLESHKQMVGREDLRRPLRPLGHQHAVGAALVHRQLLRLLRRLQPVEVRVIEFALPTLVLAHQYERLRRHAPLEPHTAGDPLHEHRLA